MARHPRCDDIKNGSLPNALFLNIFSIMRFGNESFFTALNRFSHLHKLSLPALELPLLHSMILRFIRKWNPWQKKVTTSISSLFPIHSMSPYKWSIWIEVVTKIKSIHIFFLMTAPNLLFICCIVQGIMIYCIQMEDN